MFNMLSEAPGKVEYSSIGGLGEQIRELRESIELPLMNPELFFTGWDCASERGVVVRTSGYERRVVGERRLRVTSIARF